MVKCIISAPFHHQIEFIHLLLNTLPIYPCLDKQISPHCSYVGKFKKSEQCKNCALEPQWITLSTLRELWRVMSSDLSRGSHRPDYTCLALSQVGQRDITHTWRTTVSIRSQQRPLTDRGENDPNTHTKTTVETYLRLFPQGPQGGAPLPHHFSHRLPTAPAMAWLDPEEELETETDKERMTQN